MSFLSDEISSRLETIKALEKTLNIRLKDTPTGRLRTTTASGGKTKYYHITKSGDTNGKYILHSNIELAKRLAQKDYDCKILKMLKKEERLLRSISSFYNKYSNSTSGPSFFSGPEELLWGSLANARKNLINPIEYDNDSFIAAWKSETYESKGFKEDGNEYYTGNGIRVRSKSELIIAEMLDRKGIPYYYEKPLYLYGIGIVHPDFTVLNIKHRKTLYWEHMGMMDNENYTEYALEKINHYMMNGHFPGKDLILTHESSKSPVRSQILENVIETYIMN